MNRKVLSIILVFLFFSFVNHAQYFEWVSHHPSQYSLNPDMIEAPLAITTDGEVNARLDSFATHFGQDAFARIIVEKRDASGLAVWNISLSNKVFVKKITADQNDNLYIGGSFMDTLDIDGTHQLANTGSGSNTNLFLLKLDPNGQLIWMRNLALNHPQTHLEDLQVDPAGNLWYAMNDFNNSALYKIDLNGNLNDSLIQQGALIVSSFSFDPWGNIFITGATENGTMTFGNQNFTAPDSYNKFIGRYDLNRNASWAYFANDITFQHPKIVSDLFGNAYLCGLIYDSTTFGTLTFLRPQWGQEFILLKIDSSGVFQWGKSNPAGSLPITGRFNPVSADCIATDDAGNIYMSGRSAGVLDWGNGVVLTAGSGMLSENLLSIVSFDPNGSINWGKIFGSNSYSGFHSLKVTGDGDCYFNAGFRDTSIFDSLTFIGGSDVNFVTGKISLSGMTEITELKNNLLSIYPVPSTGAIHLDGNQEAEIRIYDISGKLLRSEIHNFQQAYDAGNLPDGFYLIQLLDGRQIENFSWMKVSK